MNPPSSPPACLSDWLVYITIGTISLLGYFLWFFVRKGILERLDKVGVMITEFMTECHKCQMENRKDFVLKTEYLQLLGVRQEAHKVINGRLEILEGGQKVIEAKLDTFHQDIGQKMNRLSKTFVFRDAVISMRLDNLSDKVGVDKWTKEKETQLAEDLKEKFEADDI